VYTGKLWQEISESDGQQPSTHRTQKNPQHMMLEIQVLVWDRHNKMNCELMLTYDTPVGIWRVKKHFPRYGVPIWSLWPNIRFLPSIVAEKNATKNGHIQNVCSMCIKINKVGKQEVGIWWVQKHFPRYGVPIWSLWPNIRFLPSIVAEKNVTKNVHICSMCIKTN
jgi:hypothetical protein